MSSDRVENRIRTEFRNSTRIHVGLQVHVYGFPHPQLHQLTFVLNPASLLASLLRRKSAF